MQVENACDTRLHPNRSHTDPKHTSTHLCSENLQKKDKNLSQQMEMIAAKQYAMHGKYKSVHKPNRINDKPKVARKHLWYLSLCLDKPFWLWRHAHGSSIKIMGYTNLS